MILLKNWKRGIFDQTHMNVGIWRSSCTGLFMKHKFLLIPEVSLARSKVGSAELVVLGCRSSVSGLISSSESRSVNID